MRTPQEIRDIILDLLKKEKISVNKMLVDCGYNQNLVNDLKKGQMPSADKVAGMANFLGVSTDYLLGNEHLQSDVNDADSEKDFIKELRRILYGTSSHKLGESDKKIIIELVGMLSKIKSGEKK